MVVQALNNIIRKIRSRFAEMYRPEKHYMRGRGPAWAGKHTAMQGASGARACEPEAVDPANGAMAKKLD